VGGASFGGFVAIELARHVDARACFLIGSVRSAEELPLRVRALRRLGGLTKVVPFEWLCRAAGRSADLFGFCSGPTTPRLLRQLSDADAAFLRWATRAVLTWQPDPSPLHIPIYHIPRRPRSRAAACVHARRPRRPRRRARAFHDARRGGERLPPRAHGAARAGACRRAMMRGVFAGKPIIGIAGGIGSGKSFVAQLFAECGALVISSDEQVTDAYRDPQVRKMLIDWWGADAVRPDGQINRRLIGAKVFADPAERKRLEDLLHPRVRAARERAMAAAAKDPKVVAFVWDTPLLFETDLHRACDAVVFVDAPLETRLARVTQTRNWDAAELARRENSQWGLDRKRNFADYVISNIAGVDFARGQVQDVLSRILAKTNRQQSP
jgi:dephospho-CoA kinase